MYFSPPKFTSQNPDNDFMRGTTWGDANEGQIIIFGPAMPST